MSRRWLVFPGAMLACTALVALADTGGPGDASLERGRYLVKIAGCNDCHTPGYALAGGNVPEEQWLVGDRLGWRGPWGTTYPINLRLFMQDLSEEGWVEFARHRESRPPMPWFALREMSSEDLVAIYRFTRALGPAGDPAPAFVPPDREPAGPFVLFPAPPPAAP